MRSAIVFVITFFAASANGQTLISTMTGAGGEHFGAAVVPAGDQDGDGYVDLLVGAPYFNNGEGMVRCVSGRYLATGAGASVLWTHNGGSGFGTHYGSSIANVGDMTGDGVVDFVVGEPDMRFNFGPFLLSGGVSLLDGATHTTVCNFHTDGNASFGQVVVAVGDQDGDGLSEVAANAPDLDGDPSLVYIIAGSAFLGGSSHIYYAQHWTLSNGSNSLGEALASGFDLDGDGFDDLAIGSPRTSGGTLSIVQADGKFFQLASYAGSNNEHMGAAISAANDYDGDGVVDFVVGAPHWGLIVNSSEDGRAVVLSGAKLRAHTPPYELAVFTNPSGLGPNSHHFGTSVCASADLTGDGVGDILVGSPDFGTIVPFGPGKGTAVVFSGATLTKIENVTGFNNDRLGDVLVGAVQDIDGDSFPEFVVAGSSSDSAGADNGKLNLYRSFPAYPLVYCTSKINSLGCAPTIGSSGFASASSAAMFSLTCSSELNQTSGLFFYSHQPNASAFQGGTLCVRMPIRRSPLLSSGGSSSGSDCTGSFSWNFNAHVQSGVDPTLVAGAQIFAQCWSRDPASASTTSLSNALRLLINP